MRTNQVATTAYGRGLAKSADSILQSRHTGCENENLRCTQEFSSDRAVVGGLKSERQRLPKFRPTRKFQCGTDRSRAINKCGARNLRLLRKGLAPFGADFPFAQSFRRCRYFCQSMCFDLPSASSRTFRIANLMGELPACRMHICRCSESVVDPLCLCLYQRVTNGFRQYPIWK